jgi:drug/metabolite transporter (DMT)-like permease
MSHAGEIAALATAVCWTITALAFESAGRRIGALSLNLIRLVLGFTMLSLYTWVARGLVLPLDATPTAWLWLSVSGLVGFTIGDLCLFRAFVLIGSRLSMLIMALVPPMTAVLGWLIMGEVLTAIELGGMALAIVGVVWVVTERPPSEENESSTRRPTSGVALAVVGALGQAFGLVLSKLGMGSYDPFAATQIRAIAGIAGFVVVFSLIGWWPRVASAVRDRTAMKRTGIGAFFGPFLGVSFSLMAVQLTEAGVAATLMSLTPIMIILPSALLFGDRITARSVGGAVVAVAGCALLFM